MRRVLAPGLVILASLLAFLALPALWVNRQVLDTDNWVDASSELLQVPAVRSLTAGYLADKAYEESGVEERLRAALPTRLQPLAAPAAGLLRDRLDKRASEALARPEVQKLWEDANRQAHEKLLDALSSQGPVTVDLHNVLNAVEQRAGVGGRAADVVPEGAATVTVLRSDQLDAARRGSRILNALPIVLIVLSLACFGGALAAAGPGRRRRVVGGFGFGLLAAGALALGATRWMGDAAVSSLGTTAETADAVQGSWPIMTRLLVEAATATVLYGVVLVLGAWLAGPSGWAVAVRRFAAPGLRRPEIAWGGFAVLAGIVILWWAPTPATRNPLTALLLVILLGAGVEALRRQTAREFPEPQVDEAPPPPAPAPDATDGVSTGA